MTFLSCRSSGIYGDNLLGEPFGLSRVCPPCLADAGPGCSLVRRQRLHHALNFVRRAR